MENSEQKQKICPYALSGYPQRITFIRKKEEALDDILSINYVICSLDYVDIFQIGKCKSLLRNVTLDYVRQRLPSCLYFYCGKSVIVNMSRVKSCRLMGRRIRLVLIRGKVLYVTRLRAMFFVALASIYPNIIGIDEIKQLFPWPK
jgi:DNA-binding LytR/AlgR family response regulator